MKKLSMTFLQVVQCLSDGRFYDGTSLGEQLGITRSAVWKIIKKLEQLGVAIESVKGKGYRLLQPLILLHEEQINQHLKAENIHVDVYESVASTNACFDDVKREGVVAAVAECQTAGRGRLKREWVSPFGKNLYCSCRYPFQSDMSQLSGLSLIVSLAMVHAIETVTGLNGQLQVKWPNDVFYQGAKLAGTLIEIHAEPHGFCQVVIGMGVNVNMLSDKDGKIQREWTSLQKITAQSWDRNLLAVELLRQLQCYILRFEQNGLADFMAEWHALDSLKDKAITLNCMGKKIKGTAQGINALGHLSLCLPDGSVCHLAAGDVTTQV